jgi:hypothetical protein
MVIAIANFIRGAKTKAIVLITGLLVADNGNYIVADNGDRFIVTTRQP